MAIATDHFDTRSRVVSPTVPMGVRDDGALEHDTWACSHVGDTLHSLEHHVSNEARDAEAERRGLNHEQVDLLIRVFRLYTDVRIAGNAHATGVTICKNSVIYRQLCLALGDIVLGVE